MLVTSDLLREPLLAVAPSKCLLSPLFCAARPSWPRRPTRRAFHVRPAVVTDYVVMLGAVFVSSQQRLSLSIQRGGRSLAVLSGPTLCSHWELHVRSKPSARRVRTIGLSGVAGAFSTRCTSLSHLRKWLRLEPTDEFWVIPARHHELHVPLAAHHLRGVSSVQHSAVQPLHEPPVCSCLKAVRNTAPDGC